jgi:ABC-type uncharacterized transport system YnjBCD ATPase subunit
MVFQNYPHYPHMPIFENMAFGLRIAKKNNDFITETIGPTAKALGLEKMLERKPQALSGGQRQRVALGRHCSKPQGLLFDEPIIQSGCQNARSDALGDLPALRRTRDAAVPRRKARRAIVADFSSFIGLVLFSVLLLMLLPAQQSRGKLRKSADPREMTT